MFSAKQQKNPVSRTISAPVRKDVRQRVWEPVTMREVSNRQGVLEPQFDYQGRPVIPFCVFNPNRDLRSIEFGMDNQYAMVSFRFILPPDNDRDAVHVENPWNIVTDQDYIALVDTGYNNGYLLSSLYNMEAVYKKIHIHAVSYLYEQNEYNGVWGTENSLVLEQLRDIMASNPDFRSELMMAGSLTKRGEQWVRFNNYRMAYSFINKKGAIMNATRTHTGRDQSTYGWTYYLKGYSGILLSRSELNQECPDREAQENYNQGLKEYSMMYPWSIINSSGIVLKDKYNSLSEDSKRAIREGRDWYSQKYNIPTQ